MFWLLLSIIASSIQLLIPPNPSLTRDQLIQPWERIENQHDNEDDHADDPILHKVVVDRPYDVKCQVVNIQEEKQREEYGHHEDPNESNDQDDSWVKEVQDKLDQYCGVVAWLDDSIEVGGVKTKDVGDPTDCPVKEILIQVCDKALTVVKLRQNLPFTAYYC